MRKIFRFLVLQMILVMFFVMAIQKPAFAVETVELEIGEVFTSSGKSNNDELFEDYVKTRLMTEDAPQVTGRRGAKLKGLSKAIYDKFIVIALDNNNNVVATSKIIHVATKGGKNGNHTKVTTRAKGNKVNIKRGKTFKLKAKAVKGKQKVKNPPTLRTVYVRRSK